MRLVMASDALTEFAWERQPEAAGLVGELVNDFLNEVPSARKLAVRMRDETGTRFHDWIAHIHTGRTVDMEQRLLAAGYVVDGPASGVTCYRQPHGVFPAILLSKS